MTQSSRSRRAPKPAQLDMKRLLLFLSLALTSVVCTACAESDKAVPVVVGIERVDRMFAELDGSCKYPVVEENKRDLTTSCVLESLKERCNEIDDCLVYCLGNDIGENIGGGCGHLCYAGSQKLWNPPESMEQCESVP